MSKDFAPSIGDNYSEYPDDEAGYLYHAWEVTSTGEAASHDRWLLWPGQETLPPADALSDLERWALARRCAQLQRHEDVLTITAAILAEPREHPALNYVEIALKRAELLATGGLLDDALRIVSEFENTAHTWPMSPARARAWLTLKAGDADAADRLYRDALATEDRPGDALFEIAEDFVRALAIRQAHAWLDRTDAHLDATGDSATRVDLELLRSELHALEAATDDHDI